MVFHEVTTLPLPDGQVIESNDSIKATMVADTQVKVPEINIIDNLIYEVKFMTQAPIPIIYTSFLSAIASSCQSFLDVEIKPGLNAPTNLYLMVLAESGERKSSVDKILSRPLFDMNNEINNKNKRLKIHYDGELVKWNIKQKNIQKKYNKAVKSDNDDDISKFGSELTFIHENKPQLAQLTDILYNDITTEALLYNLSKECPNTTLTSSDASNILNKFNYHYLSNLNKLWDGDSIQVDRRTKDSFFVHDARLSISLMIQPTVFDDMLAKKNNILRTTGTLSRMLLTGGYSTKGSRFYSEHQEGGYLNAFYHRINELHKKSQEMIKSGKSKILAKMTPEAKSVWVAFYNDIEELQIRELADISDFSSKIANNVARVAALLHYYLYDNEFICKACMEEAIAFGHDCLTCFKSLFGEKTIEEQSRHYADLLFSWLRKNNRPGVFNILKKHIYNYGPNQLRNKDNLEMALWYMHNQGDIQYYCNAKPSVITLTPKFLSNIRYY